MRTTYVLLALVTAACARAPAQQAPVQPAAAADAALADVISSIRPEDFYARIGFLASDALQGRDTPSPGLEAAAAYIASEFHRFGLRPGGDAETFIQRWPFVTRVLDVPNTHFEIITGAQPRPLVYRSDFYAAGAARGSFTGALIYAGRELPAPDVRGTLRDHAVIIAPENVQQNMGRVRAAADSAGASALIVVLPANVDATIIASSATSAERGGRGVASIPVFYLRHERARELFTAARLDFNALTGASPAARPVPLPNVTARLAAAMIETDHRPPNVVGILTGSDPALRDTYIVLSAHIDHTGNSASCPPQGEDRICNGADDDASGTSAIIELAEAFAMLPVPPKRSLIFLGVSGEEKGLLGSRYYADHPTVPIESIVANINIDMIGRNNPDSVVAIGQTYSSLGPLVQHINRQHPELRMTVSDDLWPNERFFFRSDHFNFARREVPAIFFFTGTHEDYHRPSDTVDKINLDKITRITRLIFHLASAVASDPQPPKWDPAGLEEVRRLTTQGR